MAVLPLAVGATALVVLVAGLLGYYGNRAEHAWYVSLIAFISWFFPFFVIVLVPLDLASTLSQQCKGEECTEPLLFVSSEFLVAAWRMIYWSSFVLTWAMIPLLQVYTQSGEFTVMKRLRHAIRYNIIYQLIIGAVALLGLVYVWYYQGTSNLRAYIMALSNSWGLILVIVFMGYGMVDVPRRLWHKGDNARELRRLAFQASVVKDRRQDTEDEVLHVAKELSVVCHKVQLSDPLRPYVDQMVEGFPAVRGVQFESSRTVPSITSSQSHRGDPGGAAIGSSRFASGLSTGGRKHFTDALVPATVTEKYLADLNARIKRALRMNDRWTAIWQNLLKAGFLAQDIQENADSPEKKFRSTLRPLASKPKEWELSFEWYWHLKLRPVLLRSFAIFCAVLSLLIVWSEMTYQNINPILSVIGLLVQLARDQMSYGAIEAISFLTMLYMCTCAYLSLMKMKLLSNYVLVPNHHTDEPTLLFIGSYLCRLTFPLVYNYLTISSHGKEDNTEFAAYMGKIDMVPFLGEFNYYMPYVILAPVLITLFNVFAKMFALCNISDNFFDNDDGDGGIGGDLEEGLQVLKDARHDEERRLMPDRVGMNRDFTARRGAAFESYKNKKNRRRGDSATQSMLGGEGSSANAWRDVRPYSSGTPRPFQDHYADDTTDDDDGDDTSSVQTGFGHRESFDPFGATGAGGGAGGGMASSRNTHRNSAKLDTQPKPGPLKSIWQKFVGPKQAISLDNTTSSDPMDSDGGRSSLEDQRQHRQQQRPPRTFRQDQSPSGARTGPALMFASVQQNPSGYGRSLQDEERERLLSVNDARLSSNSSSAYSSRAQSPQGRMTPTNQPGRTSRPTSRIFGTSQPSGGGGAATAAAAGGNSARVFGSSPRTGGRPAGPLVNIFDDD
ncbi:MAG: LMBR1-like membrane protein-domain-containing protein [Benniella sp.]|nr:MAG: LMBR1-like membrane protein-domain-containing protein [Benniella sp.]